MSSGRRTPISNPLDFGRHVPARLLTISSKIALHATRHAARPAGMSIREWRLVQIIGAFGPLTINEAAQRIAMDFGGTSRAIAQLESKGLIRRMAQGEDRRVSRVELTETGRVAHNDFARFAHAREERLLSGLSAAEREELLRLLARVDESISEMLEEPEGPAP